MQERGLLGERGGEEVRSLQGLISEDEEGGEEEDGEDDDGWKEEDEGDDDEQMLLVLGLPPSPAKIQFIVFQKFCSEKSEMNF